MWQLSSRAAVDYFCLIKWHSPSVILSRSKNTLFLDTTLSFLTHLIVSCGMKKQKYIWHLLNVPFWLPFIWFYYYSFCHCLNFIPWLCFVAVAIRSFCYLCVFVWCDFSSSLTSHSLLLEQIRNKISEQLSLGMISHTHLSPGKGTVNGPKSALFTPGEKIKVCLQIASVIFH